jgi:hypothetical protein
VSFFWLNYRYPDGQFAGAVVIEASALIIARMQAAVFGLDEGLSFAGGRAIDDARVDQIPESMVDRLLDHRYLRTASAAPHQEAAAAIGQGRATSETATKRGAASDGCA